MMLVSQECESAKPFCQVLALGHEDQPSPTDFEQGELDDLEHYDGGLELEEDDALEAEIDDSKLNGLVDRLCRPYSSEEPNVPADELAILDGLGDQVEISRLKGLGVLLPTSALPQGEVKRLTTRFVRTWRDKFIGAQHKWLRCSGYVAREFAWLQEIDKIFSRQHLALSPVDRCSMHFCRERTMIRCKLWPFLTLVMHASR